MASRYTKLNRKQTGSITLLALIVCTLIVIPVVLSLSGAIQLWTTRQKLSTATERACLVVAGNLSKIVISDPYWGFISLSDYPASGSATLAGDGEPLPVIGINTVIGTARLELIVAESLGDTSLIELAREDVAAARQASRRLETALCDSLSAESRNKYMDMNGEFIEPFIAAEKSVNDYLAKTNCPSGKPRLKTLKLTLGWLSGGAETITPVPKPLDLAAIEKGESIGDCYKAFRNLAIGDESFYFAGVGRQSGLVNAKEFRLPDGQRICSIVRLELNVAFIEDSKGDSPVSMATVACALPHAMPDCAAPGVMVLNFPKGHAGNLRSIHDLLSVNNSGNQPVELMQAVNGDFPVDPGSSLTSVSANGTSTSYLLAMGFRDWIRNAHCKPRIDSLLEAANAQFPCSYVSSGNPVLLLYDIDENGSIMTEQFKDGICFKQTVSEKQRYAYFSDASNPNNLNIAIKLTDHVNVLTRQEGGKHAGQALIDELPVDYSAPSARKIQQELLASLAEKASRFRRSYIHGGLAVSLEIVPSG